MQGRASLDRSQFSNGRRSRDTRQTVMLGRREPPRQRREDRQNFVRSEYNKRRGGHLHLNATRCTALTRIQPRQCTHW